MLSAILSIIGGLVLLTAGGESLVRGAYALSLRLRLTPAVIGLTVMAVGTSLPEMLTSIVAQLEGSPDLSLGNIVGSNLFNIGVVLGVCGLLRPLNIPGSTVRLEWPFMLIASLILLLLARDGQLDALEGSFFLVSFALFTAFMVRYARREVGEAESHAYEEAMADLARKGRGGELPLVTPALLVIGGGVALWYGADLLVAGAVSIAQRYPEVVSERVIALTVVAGGTGLPELVATFVAVLHRKTDMAVGNVIGSNICNVLLVAGAASLVRPLPVNERILEFDILWMLGISLLLGPFLVGRRLNRPESLALLLVYAAYGASLYVLRG